MSTRKVPHKLAMARAYWRVAAKKRRNATTNAEFREADRYQAIADRFHEAYLRDKEFHERLKGDA